jgi:hypothetical protein
MNFVKEIHFVKRAKYNLFKSPIENEKLIELIDTIM